MSGVSTWIERVLTSPRTRHDWHAVITGSRAEHEAMAAFPGESSGCVTRCVWDTSAQAVEPRIESLSRCVRSLGGSVVIPNYVPEAFAAGFLASARGVRVVGVCHSRDVWYHELFEQCGAGLDGAWAVSDECRRLIGHTLGPSTPVLTAPYGTALPAPKLFEGRPAGSPVRLLYAGRLDSMQKRVMRLAELADTLADRGIPFTLIIAGDGPERARLEARLSPHVSRGDVVFTGPVSRALVDEHLRASDALVLVSAYEGTPLAVMEAMAMGRPVLISRGCGGACDAVRESGGGMISGSVEELAEHVRTLADNPDQVAALSAEARRAAELHFDLRTHLERLERLIDETAASPRPAPGEVWGSAMRAAALGAQRGARDLRRRTLFRWRRCFLRDARARRGSTAPRRADFSIKRPNITRAGSKLLRAAVRDLADRGCRQIAIFPAGRHSARFGTTLRRMGEVACYVDDAGGNRRLHGRPVLTPNQALSHGIDAVVISSDQHEDTLRERALEWAGDRPIRTLYVPIWIDGSPGACHPNEHEVGVPTVRVLRERNSATPDTPGEPVRSV